MTPLHLSDPRRQLGAGCALVCLLAWLPGCPLEVQLGDQVFACSSDADCVDGFLCIDGLCLSANEAASVGDRDGGRGVVDDLDAGPVVLNDAGSDVADAGKPGGGTGGGADAGRGPDAGGAVTRPDAGGGSLDAGTSDGGAVDGGTSDGGTSDGGAIDGGAIDGGAVDGGATFDAGPPPAICGNNRLEADEECDDGNVIDLDGCSSQCLLTFDLTAGLVAHWDFEEGSGTQAFDVTGGGSDGLIHDATYVPGRVGTALAFDGATSWVELGTPATLDIQGAVTLVAWVKPSVREAKGAVIQHGPDGNQRLVALAQNDGRFVGVSGDESSRLVQVTPVLGADVGQWTHLVQVFQAGEWTLYKNGVAAQTSAQALGAISSSAPWGIGANAYGTNRFFSGALDDVRVYNRALSSEEVVALFASQAPPLCGDGQLNAQEACDDGNDVNADGCSACTVDPGFFCQLGSCAPIDPVVAHFEPQSPVSIVSNVFDGTTTSSMTCESLTILPPYGVGAVQDVELTLAMDHTWVNDLTLRVVSPDGTEVTVFSRPGGGGNGAKLSAAAPIRFFDTAPTSADQLGEAGGFENQTICADDSICDYFPDDGTGIPSGFRSYRMREAADQWKVCLGDDVGEDDGTLYSLSLTVTAW